MRSNSIVAGVTIRHTLIIPACWYGKSEKRVQPGEKKSRPNYAQREKKTPTRNMKLRHYWVLTCPQIQKIPLLPEIIKKLLQKTSMNSIVYMYIYVVIFFSSFGHISSCSHLCPERRAGWTQSDRRAHALPEVLGAIREVCRAWQAF